MKHYYSGHNQIPNDTKHLVFTYGFNSPINSLPNTITHLTLGHNFNQSLSNLPNSITHLILGNNFNKPLNNLPNSITHLTFNHNFNQLINKIVKFVNIFIFTDYNSYLRYREELLNKNVIYKMIIRYEYYTLVSYHYKFYNFKVVSINYEDVCNIAEFQYFIHNKFFKLLTTYVFNPQRLLKIAEKYNLTIDEYLDFL